MTEATKTAIKIDRFLQEHADGYFFLGFDPITQEPITCLHTKDGKTETALNATLGGILAAGGVAAVVNAIKRKEQGEAGS